jgi:hypothetical protein
LNYGSFETFVLLAYAVIFTLLIAYHMQSTHRLRKQVERMRKQAEYQDVRVTRWYREGRMVKEIIEPVPLIDTKDGTLPLPNGLGAHRRQALLDLDVPPPGTRMSELDERAKLE